jgi:hypothetical protein
MILLLRPARLALTGCLPAEVIEIHRVTGWYRKCSKWDSFRRGRHRIIFEWKKGAGHKTVSTTCSVAAGRAVCCIQVPRAQNHMLTETFRD